MTHPRAALSSLFGASSLLALASCSASPVVRQHPMPSSVSELHASGALSSEQGNPFVDTTLFVNPAFTTRVQSSAKAAGLSQQQVDTVAYSSTALWLDRIAVLDQLPAYLDQARAAAKRQGRPSSVTLVVYNLPERDCNANASNGELTLDQDGLNKYRGYIDRIAAITAAYSDVKIAAIVEPDSLPNIVTNLANPKCARAKDAYESGVAYAIRSLAASRVVIYLDSAHGGWLGWPDNRQRMAQEVRRVLDAAGGVDLIRGFSSNVANYSPLSVDLSQVGGWYDPSNPAKDEWTFTRLMADEYAKAGINHRAFVIDTGRNGVVNSRQFWRNWCNVRGAGIGERPRVAPAEGIDAYLWIKPPGESDGTSDPQSSRYDSFCGNEDAASAAPQAGEWFESHFLGLVARANPRL